MSVSGLLDIHKQGAFLMNGCSFKKAFVGDIVLSKM